MTSFDAYREDERRENRESELASIQAKDTFDNEHMKGAWETFGLHSKLISALDDRGYVAPTDVQFMAIPATIRQGRDVLGAAHTGSGKTLAFAIPILHFLLEEKDKQAEEGIEDDYESRSLKALVVTPTRELAMQVCNHIVVLAKPLGLSAIPIVGGMSQEKQQRQLKAKPHIIVGTPGRLWELLVSELNSLVDVSKLRFLAIDEADRMCVPGAFPEFRKVLDHIIKQEKEVSRWKINYNKAAESLESKATAGVKRQTLMFSATLMLPTVDVTKAPKTIKKKGDKSNDDESPLIKLMSEIGLRGKPAIINSDANSSGTNGGDRRGGSGGVNLPESLQLSIYEALDDNAKDEFLYYFYLQYPGRTLVFVNSIKTLRRLTSFCEELNMTHLSLHAGLEQKKRLKNLDVFKASSNCFMIASDVAARGLDIPNVDHVLHYHVPHNADVFVHRSGRTARALASGLSLTLIQPKEQKVWQQISAAVFGTGGRKLTHFPADNRVMRKIHPSAVLAGKIATLNRDENQKSYEVNWITKQAQEADLELDDDMISGMDSRTIRLDRAGDSNKSIATMRAELSVLLKTPMHLNGVARNFITANPDSVVKMGGRDASADLSTDGSQSKKKKFKTLKS
jgi:ATP-dependent RNA helicase DDX24/MAK5